MRTRLQFQQVSIKGVRKFKDPVTGKPRQQTRTFMQTVNPFNRDENGVVKSSVHIMRELEAERKAWLNEGNK